MDRASHLLSSRVFETKEQRLAKDPIFQSLKKTFLEDPEAFVKSVPNRLLDGSLKQFFDNLPVYPEEEDLDRFVMVEYLENLYEKHWQLFPEPYRFDPSSPFEVQSRSLSRFRSLPGIHFQIPATQTASEGNFTLLLHWKEEQGNSRINLSIELWIPEQYRSELSLETARQQLLEPGVLEDITIRRSYSLYSRLFLHFSRNQIRQRLLEFSLEELAEDFSQVPRNVFSETYPYPEAIDPEDLEDDYESEQEVRSRLEDRTVLRACLSRLINNWICENRLLPLILEGNFVNQFRIMRGKRSYLTKQNLINALSEEPVCPRCGSSELEFLTFQVIFPGMYLDHYNGYILVAPFEQEIPQLCSDCHQSRSESGGGWHSY